MVDGDLQLPESCPCAFLDCPVSRFSVTLTSYQERRNLPRLSPAHWGIRAVPLRRGLDLGGCHGWRVALTGRRAITSRPGLYLSGR